MSYIIGVSAYYHDSSACLFKDDKLLFACEEERFSGIKHDNSFPENTIKYIFDKYNLKKSDIECVCYYEDPRIRLKRKKSFFNSLQTISNVYANLKKISNKIHFTKHHMSHMMYSYLSSDFKNATIVSVDGVGEVETMTIGKGENGKITQLKSVKYPHSLGLFYSSMTAFLGFKPNEGEYKVMGLASYGTPTYYNKVKELIKIDNYFEPGELYKHDANIKCNMDYFNWDKSKNMMFNQKLEDFLELESRLPGSDINDDYKNLAASVQRVYEDVFFDIIKYAKSVCGYDNLCLGGGCAYNGTANGKITKNGIFSKIWIPPAPSDAGSSIGSCLHYLSTVKGYNIRLKDNPFLGPLYDEKDIEKEINNFDDIDRQLLSISRLDRNMLIVDVAHYINKGKVVGWFNGNIEFGARALGNRSILANPTFYSMKDRINAVIKKREGFRPFAPMICYDKQSEFYESSDFIPYMNQVVDVKEKYKKLLPAVTHIDGTARVQSVLPSNPIYDLLIEFEKISGYPILLNTSFNIKDKTMVLTPKDAIDTFFETDMDILVMGNYILMKK
jgi:carbamoyltransferase